MMNMNKVLIIDELNEYYCSLKKQIEDVNWQLKEVQKLKSETSNLLAKEYVDRFLEVVFSPDHKIVGNMDEPVESAINVAKKYKLHVNALDNYKNELKSLITQGESANGKGLDVIRETRMELDENKSDYYAKYGTNLNQLTDLYVVYENGLKHKKEYIGQELERVKEEARASFDTGHSLDMRIDENYVYDDSLPEVMLLAKLATGDKPCELLRDINRQVEYEDIFVNLKEQGNVLIETDYEQTLDKELDQFVLAYIFRYIELFPAGMVNVHIFDRNPNKYNQRLSNIFKDGSYSEKAKKTINLYDYNSLSELKSVTSVIVEDIFKKISNEHKDLYSVHEIDKTDPFTLIVLRDGLVDQSGYSASSTLECINSLTQPDESGHVCGIRFLIIDDSLSRKSIDNEATKFYIDSIRNNCSTKLVYDQKHFSFNDKIVDVLKVRDDLDEFIQHRATNLAQRITNLEKQYVSVSELDVSDRRDPNESVYRIPIGKSGNSIVEIPLSCKDDNGTVDGQCIGYMVIGQSGSGKSSFFHSVVINGCLQYSPMDLQFWLLDFKYGGASSKYRKSQIPHVRIVSENNKIDDALCLFQMIFDEMEYRNKLINGLSVDNIVEYNNLVDSSMRLPRIVVMIDEVQEIFRDDNAAEIQKMISAISVRMRSAGMHFIMIAQNLSEGKSYMLKEAFLPSATGRICFRVAENMPRESGFDEAFIQRKNEISTLSAGEAYVSWGKDTIKKVKMAYAPSEDMNNTLFAQISAKYVEYANLKPMVIGSKQRLSVNDIVQISNESYFDEINRITSSVHGYKAIVGEDAYRLSPLEVSFSPYEMSSLLILGDDKNIASSLCASITLSLVKQNAIVHLFNADRQKGQYSGAVIPHPFMYMCTLLKTHIENMVPHSLSDFNTIITDVYREYLKRVDLVQMSEDEDVPSFNSIFLVVNDLFGIRSFQNNERISSRDNSDGARLSESEMFNFDLISKQLNGGQDSKTDFDESIQTVTEKLLKDGYNYNIYLVLSLRGDPGVWRNLRVSEVNNLILFNTTQFANQVENQFFVREMLKNISSDSGEETMAIWISKKRISKIRPIIYDMSNKNELIRIETMVEGAQ